MESNKASILSKLRLHDGKISFPSRVLRVCRVVAYSTRYKLSHCALRALRDEGKVVKSFYVKRQQSHYRELRKSLTCKTLYLTSSESHCAYAHSLCRPPHELCFLILWGSLQRDEIKYLILVGRNKTNNTEYRLEHFYVSLSVNGPLKLILPQNFRMAASPPIVLLCVSAAKPKGTQKSCTVIHYLPSSPWASTVSL